MATVIPERSTKETFPSINQGRPGRRPCGRVVRDGELSTEIESVHRHVKATADGLTAGRTLMLSGSFEVQVTDRHL